MVVDRTSESLAALTALTRALDMACRYDQQLADRIIAASCSYVVLGVDPAASHDSLKKSYHSLARRFHPDKHSSEAPSVQQHCADVMARLNLAFDDLSDEDKRRRYNSRRRPRDEPQHKSKQRKVQPAHWYSKFLHAIPLSNVKLSQSAIAGYCVRQMTRLALFMDKNGDTKYNWHSMLIRYDPADTTRHSVYRDNLQLERVLWDFEGLAGYQAQVQILKNLFEHDDYPIISVHLDHLESAMKRYIRGNAAREPALLESGTSLEEACNIFVDCLRRLCVKMNSMEDKKSPWDGFLLKFPETGTQAGVTTVETVGIHDSGLVLRDILSNTNSWLVKKIANRLNVILVEIGKLLQVKASREIRTELLMLEK